MSILAQAESAVLVSIFKPLLAVLFVGGWGWVVTHLDKDAAYFYLPRRMWNLVQMICAMAGFLLLLLIPIFWVGLPVMLLVMAGGIIAYVMFRNTKVVPDQKWTLSAETFRQFRAERNFAAAQKSATFAFMTKDLVRIDVPAGNDPNVTVHKQIEALVQYALPRGADRIDAVISAESANVSVQIDGVRYPQPAIDPQSGMRLMEYVKKHAGLDPAELRKKQQGLTRIDAGDLGKHTLGVSSVGSTREAQLSIRIDPDKRFTAAFNDLGLLDSQKKLLIPALDGPHGLVIAACAPHHGLTTTLYSLMQRHDAYTSSVVTLEDDIAFEVEGAEQTLIEPGSDAKWMNDQLLRMIRQDPSVMMVSRVSDPSTAQLLADATVDGPRTYLGLQLGDTFTALRAWIKAVGDAKAAAKSLRAIVAQRLVRKLCITCRAPFAPDPEALRKMNLPADRIQQLFKESGQVIMKNQPQPCPTCHGLGFRGRIAVFEVMALDDDARKLIAAAQLDQLRAHLRKQKTLWLQEAALSRVVEGVTSVSEVQRCLAKEKE